MESALWMECAAVVGKVMTFFGVIVRSNDNSSITNSYLQFTFLSPLLATKNALEPNLLMPIFQ